MRIHKKMWLSGLGIVGILITLAAGIMNRRGGNDTRGVNNEEQMRSILITRISHDITLAQAERYMAAESFEKIVIMDPGLMKLQHIDFYRIDGWSMNPVKREWTISLIIEDGKIADLQVRSNLVGP